MKTYSFERLEVWQKARTLTAHIYSLTRAFPEEEKFGIISQMRRAAVSIGANLAEGCAKHTGKEKARFTETAFGSLMELLQHSILSYDLGFMDQTPIIRYSGSDRCYCCKNKSIA